ncbi:hypothetical protein VCJ71_00605 [Alteriqipengyuania sp. WL0013]|uniref:hypothetical protein n=1 Tax=Alteriqipengyuania sp. WL0013 TaxID=3110773 RepID=UPI002BEEF022|nr:hypothetical protein [Alteriqipengyuania sp. WL0013]MEB3414555.1 hypothetical protein [Alteriqipengyuania sp. WL0013]
MEASTDPLEYVAGYISPLTDNEHARIGRIAVLWGQVEYFVDELLEYLTGFSRSELEALGVTDRPTASKVDFLLKVKERNDDGEYRERVTEFCRLIHETRPSRNQLFHGMWGWRALDRKKRMVPAARRSDAPKQPFKATQLSGLERKLCKTSRLGQDLCAPLFGAQHRAKLNRFVHHDDDDDIRWMTDWCERNPINGDHLDRAWKDGQLPRLRALLPEA